jgi:TolA-binding protein
MGLGETFDFGKPIIKNPVLKTPIDYVKHADALAVLVPRNEAELYQYQAAYVQLFSGSEKVALTRFESAFTKFPRNPKAPIAASALLDYLFEKKSMVESERFVRLFIKLTLIPSKEGYRELPKLLERTIFELAKAEYDAKKFETAAVKLSNFQREFPASTRSPEALEMAGRAFYETKKVNRAIAVYEDYLKWYPKLESAKNIRWMAAELMFATKNYEKAAQNYQAFNQLYPQDALVKKAALKSAESYRAANKIPEAISEYEKYLQKLTVNAEKVQILKIISENALDANVPLVALSALERLSKIVKQPSKVLDAQFNLMLIYQKMGRLDDSRKSAATILAMKPTDAEGFKIHAKARYAAAKSGIEAIRTRQVMREKDLKSALQNLFNDYEKTKSDLLAPCEIPGVDWCALGYYEASKLAGDLNRMLAVVEPSNYLDENTVAEIKSLVSWNKDKLASESKSFALQAEDALVSSGIPEKDAAERIRMHAQQTKISRESSDSEDSEDVAGF